MVCGSGGLATSPAFAAAAAHVRATGAACAQPGRSHHHAIPPARCGRGPCAAELCLARTAGCESPFLGIFSLPAAAINLALHSSASLGQLDVSRLFSIFDAPAANLHSSNTLGFECSCWLEFQLGWSGNGPSLVASTSAGRHANASLQGSMLLHSCFTQGFQVLTPRAAGALVRMHATLRASMLLHLCSLTRAPRRGSRSPRLVLQAP